jgi:hypothetical protein
MEKRNPGSGNFRSNIPKWSYQCTFLGYSPDKDITISEEVCETRRATP